MSFWKIALVVSCCLVGACRSSNGSDDNNGNEDGGSNGGNGRIACGSVTCEAGQHCDNLFCVAGCLTVNNCPANHSCENPGPAGVCTPNQTQQPDASTPNVDCVAFCDKAIDCGAPSSGRSACLSNCSSGDVSAACAQCFSTTSCNDIDACTGSCAGGGGGGGGGGSEVLTGVGGTDDQCQHTAAIQSYMEACGCNGDCTTGLCLHVGAAVGYCTQGCSIEHDCDIDADDTNTYLCSAASGASGEVCYRQ